MHSLWNTIAYQPILNSLVLTIDKVTFGDVGFAIILVTILIKLILSPLTKTSIRSQILMKKMEPELKLIKKNFPNKEEQASKTFELYKKYNTNPFSGCLVIFIQIPFIIALYYVFWKGLSLNPTEIYSFIHIPANINTKVEIIKETDIPEVKTFQEELSGSMQTNIKYFLPIVITFFSYQISAAVALYWFTSTMFTVAQEWYMRRKLSNN